MDHWFLNDKFKTASGNFRNGIPMLEVAVRHSCNIDVHMLNTNCYFKLTQSFIHKNFLVQTCGLCHNKLCFVWSVFVIVEIVTDWFLLALFISSSVPIRTFIRQCLVLRIISSMHNQLKYQKFVHSHSMYSVFFCENIK